MSKKRQIDESRASTSSKRRHLAEVNNDDDVIPHNNDAIRSGKISKMHLINFMCHSNLTIEFNKRVNILSGSNGSGKSAILTALVVGLGSRARDTNRSSNIKQLIKNGEISCDVEITIDNNGSDTYEHNVYGNFITICRHITQSGSSTYKIKDATGHVITKKVDDLQKILLYHNIQVDNPVFVLNQENSRTFLKDMEPSKNYQLFLKATQIETVIQKLNQCGIMYNKYKNQIDISRKELDVIKKDIEEINIKCEYLQSVDQIKINIHEYKLEQLWLKVNNQEDIVNKLNDIINNIKKKKEEMQNLVDNYTSIEDEYKIEMHKLKTELQKQSNFVHAENEKLNNLNEIYTAAYEKYQNKTNELKKDDYIISNTTREINLIKTRIAEKSGSQVSNIEKMRNENEQKLKKLMEAQEETKSLILQQKLDLNMINETKMKYEDQFDALKSQRVVFMKNIDSLNHKVTALRAYSKNPISLYGPQMTQFLDEIKKAYEKGAFSELPRGPLGLYIQVPNEKWRGTIEHLLHGLIKVFVVNNNQDQKLFDKIKSRFKDFKPTVILTKFSNQIYNVTKGMVSPPNGTALLMNEIICNDPVVMNCLIDFAKVETILLTESQQLAVDLTSDETSVPKNLNRLILLKPFLEYLPAPLYRTYANKMRKPQFLQVNVDEIKSNIENDVKHNETQKYNCETKLHDLKSKLQDIYKKIKENTIIMEKHQNVEEINVDKIKEINSIEYPEESHIEFYKKEQLELEKKIQEITISYSQKQLEIKELLQQKINSLKAYQKQKELLNNNEKEENGRRRKIDEFKLKLTKLLSDVKNWKEQNLELNENFQKEMDKLNNENFILNREIEIASQQGERIPVTKSNDTLNNLIIKSEYQIKQICSTQESLEDLKALLDDKKLNYKKKETFINTFTELLDSMKKSRLDRFKFIINLKQHMALRVKYTFDNVLKVKNFVGNIKIDHKEQKLHMKIIPRDNHIENAVSNTKSLSGGERSYSTIALLLSLWSCVDHPFFFLDEYDVFTDEINREIMTALLLNEAKNKPQQQYSFLTPQDISFVQASNITTIHKLTEPRR